MTAALVLGGADCVWRDVGDALNLGEFDGIVACNDAGVHWPGPLDAWCSLHSSSLKLWAARRARLGLPPHPVLYGHEGARTPGSPYRFTDHRFPGQDRSGSSGLFALKVALIDLGFDKAVLCGVPMEQSGAHFFDARAWRGAESHRKGWEQALPQIKDRARSMSGWTRKMLGAPTVEWFGA